MENHRVVGPAHLNHYGYLFGGQLVAWVDEVAWIAASRDYPGCNFVTVAMDQMVFRQSVRAGAILSFHSERIHVGRTSVGYRARVTLANAGVQPEPEIFSTAITFVCLGADGGKSALQQSPDGLEGI